MESDGQQNRMDDIISDRKKKRRRRRRENERRIGCQPKTRMCIMQSYKLNISNFLFLRQTKSSLKWLLKSGFQISDFEREN
jgi:hypothetical protein